MRTLLVLAAWLVCASASAATLHIQFNGVQTMRGHLLVAVYSNAKDFKADKKLVSKQISLKGKTAPISGSIELPAGHYAVRVMQDVNDNHRMDVNRMGIPAEPVGSSNNPQVPRAPTFQDSAFTLPAAGKSIDIDMFMVHI